MSASRRVETGEVFGLDYPIDAFTPGMSKARQAPRHRMYSNHPAHRDDVIDGLYLQGSSQVDGLRHRCADDVGFYDGTAEERISPGTPDIGIQVWADDPIVTRGVVIDIEAEYARQGRSIDHAAGQSIGLDQITAALTSQATRIEEGDVIMLHTGWAEWFLNLSLDARLAQRDSRRASGLAQSEELLDWAWDSGIALLATDNFAVECLPPIPDTPFRDSAPNDRGMMHQEFLAKLGMPLGELWRLGPLTRRLHQLNRWDTLLVVKPLNIVGAAGSPANATAIL